LQGIWGSIFSFTLKSPLNQNVWNSEVFNINVCSYYYYFKRETVNKDVLKIFGLFKGVHNTHKPHYPQTPREWQLLNFAQLSFPVLDAKFTLCLFWNIVKYYRGWGGFRN